jgi:hypothetical protein
MRLHAKPPSKQPTSTAPQAPRILCVSWRFSPDTAPGAIQASKLLQELGAYWNFTVITETTSPNQHGKVHVRQVRSLPVRRLLDFLRRVGLSKLVELFIWPDERIFWVLPAIVAGRRLIRATKPSAIVVFMMPFSSGLVGVALSKLAGLPLILKLNDSLTCTDMSPSFPSKLHYRFARALEDFYVNRADAIIYVSKTNLEAVRSRHPKGSAEKFHLVRSAADDGDFATTRQPASDGFEILYAGGMTGWHALIEQHSSVSRPRRIYRAWNRLGKYQLTAIDHRTSSPAVIGQAILAAVSAHPEWRGRIRLRVIGDRSSGLVVERALALTGVERVVAVSGPVPHNEVADLLCEADMLFLTLPRRPDGSRGGRISAKTYEYLMTDRPILAAVPPGENWDYLSGKPGVWLVDPDDDLRMTELIARLAKAKFAGTAARFDRRELREQLSHRTRAKEFAAVMRAVIAPPAGHETSINRPSPSRRR